MTATLGRDELIHHHALLFQVRYLAEKAGLVDSGAFAEYDALGVTPVSVHRDKPTHTHAIRVLARCLDQALHPDRIERGRRL